MRVQSGKYLMEVLARLQTPSAVLSQPFHHQGQSIILQSHLTCQRLNFNRVVPQEFDVVEGFLTYMACSLAGLRLVVMALLLQMLVLPTEVVKRSL